MTPGPIESDSLATIASTRRSRRWLWRVLLLVLLAAIFTPLCFYYQRHVLIPLRLERHGWDVGGPDETPSFLADLRIPGVEHYFTQWFYARHNPREPIDEQDLRDVVALSTLDGLLVDHPESQFRSQWFSILAHHPNIRTAYFHVDALRVQDLVHLATLPRLINLRLSGAGVTDDAIAHLSPLFQLETLGVGGSRVTDAGLVHLATLVNLRDLELAGTRITGTAFENLSTMRSLRLLDLSSTPVNGNGLTHLSRLPITRLILSDTTLSDEDIRVLAPMTRLERVDLDYTHISDASAVILSGMTSLSELSLGHTAITDVALERLASLPKLDTLSLIGTSVTPAGLQHLNRLSNLSTLYLSGVPLTDKAVPILKTLPSSIYLQVDVSGLSTLALEELRGYFRNLSEN